MKIQCEFTAQEVYEIVGNELTKYGLKWSKLNSKIKSSMVFDGMTFQIEIKEEEKTKKYDLQNYIKGRVY